MIDPYNFSAEGLREKQIFAAGCNFELTPRKEKMNVIVFSYNRPKLLKEALNSAIDADRIIITDDASDFDVEDVVKESDIDVQVTVVEASPTSPQKRIDNPRFGKLINKALSLIDEGLVTYLCDDDLFAEGWLNTARDWLSERPACHIVKGQLNYFNDGEDLKDSKKVYLDGRQMMTSNFVHRAQCFRDENIVWPEDRLVGLDDKFLWAIDRWHNTWMIPKIEMIAAYRRVHNKAMTHFSTGHHIGQKGRKLIEEEQWLE